MSVFETIKSISHDDKKLWETLWSKEEKSWQRNEVSQFLIESSSKLKLSPPKRVFVPLCGKALELKWFYDQGFEVVGVDFLEIPVKEFFNEHNLPFKVRQLSWAKIYETSDERLQIYVADIYDITVDEIGKFDILWVSGVYSSIKIDDREKFSNLLKQLCNENFVFFLCALQFTVKDANKVDKLPRPITEEIIQEMYGDWCNIELTEEKDALELCPFLKEGGIEEAQILCFILEPK